MPKRNSRASNSFFIVLGIENPTFVLGPSKAFKNPLRLFSIYLYLFSRATLLRTESWSSGGKWLGQNVFM
jgi:hypothetical protein